MTGVSDYMVNAVRAMLDGRNGDEMIPIGGMDNHFCSLEKKEGSDLVGYKLLFPIKVDQKQVYVYLKIS